MYLFIIIDFIISAIVSALTFILLEKNIKRRFIVLFYIFLFFIYYLSWFKYMGYHYLTLITFSIVLAISCLVGGLYSFAEIELYKVISNKENKMIIYIILLTIGWVNMQYFIRSVVLGIIGVMGFAFFLLLI